MFTPGCLFTKCTCLWSKSVAQPTKKISYLPSPPLPPNTGELFWSKLLLELKRSINNVFNRNDCRPVYGYTNIQKDCSDAALTEGFFLYGKSLKRGFVTPAWFGVFVQRIVFYALFTKIGWGTEIIIASTHQVFHLI